MFQGYVGKFLEQSSETGENSTKKSYMLDESHGGFAWFQYPFGSYRIFWIGIFTYIHFFRTSLLNVGKYAIH